MLCDHFGTCGGCLYQHLPYDEELKEKERKVFSLFSGMEASFLPIIGASSCFSYRNKMEFTFRDSLKGEKFLGLLIKKGRVITLDECLISPPWFIDILKKVYAFWQQSDLTAYYPPKNIGTFRTLMLREGVFTQERMIVLTVSGEAQFQLTKEEEEQFLQNLLPFEKPTTVVLRKQMIEKNRPTFFQETILHGSGYIEEHLFDKNGKTYCFKIKPASFFQPNTRSANILYQKALELAELQLSETVFDLYCGTATIGILASPHVKKVIAVESELSSIEDARENVMKNGVRNVDIIHSTIENVSPAELVPDVVIVDPPRTGLTEKALKKIVSFSPKKILYISCNPVTQAENIKWFMQANYHPKVVQPIDQFPRTKHVENIVVLSKQLT